MRVGVSQHLRCLSPVLGNSHAGCCKGCGGGNAPRAYSKKSTKGMHMLEVEKEIYVGSEHDCRVGDEEWAIVHACKSPCHQRAVGYRGSLSSDHPNYLFLEERFDLYLNLIDPPVPLFMSPSFFSFLGFAQRQLEEGRKLLIHCNKGESRAPSLALLALAKLRGSISNESYGNARVDFEALFSGYNPGRGIGKYLTEHWSEFNNFCQFI